MKEVRGVRDLDFYRDASKDLYNAARRDASAGRRERAGELARAAEALTHVPEHLARAEDADDRPEPKKEKAKEKEKAKRDRPEPREKEKARRERPEADADIPPPIE